MNIAFTICSNNYLAQAKTLADSFTVLNKNYKFIIGLVDIFSEKIDYSFFEPYEIIPIGEMDIIQLDQMVERYNITELNTAVKPFIFHYLFKRDPAVGSIIYLDPDILFYHPFTYLENCLVNNNIVITPHFFTPIYDNCFPTEPNILNSGIYNLGFIAVKRDEESQKFLDWWMIKLTDQCLVDFENGLFVDQLWINFVPLYFKKVFIMDHPGHNVAYWNLHERTVSVINQQPFINEKSELVFYHYSGYNPATPGIISKYQNRFTFSGRPDIVFLFKEYYALILKNNHKALSEIPCYYIEAKKVLPAKPLSAYARFVKNQKNIARKIYHMIKYPFN